MSSYNLQDKIALITGASRGIGKAIALEFARNGAKIIINYNNKLKKALKTMEACEGDQHSVFKADVSHHEELRMMFEFIDRKYKRIDIVVNNAGICFPHPITEVHFSKWQEAWKETLGVNLIGPANVCYLAADRMKVRGSGRIINITSRGAFRGEPDCPAYGASKAGMNSLTQSLAKYLAPYGIGVMAIAPGFVSTDMADQNINHDELASIESQSPFNRMATPEEVAKATLHFAQDESLFSSGAILDINGASYFR